MSEFQSSHKPVPDVIEEDKLETDKVTEYHALEETGKNTYSSSEILSQIQKQSTGQEKIEKTLASLDKSINQIRKDLEIPGNQLEQHHQLLQQHQVLDESIKQIQSQLSDLKRQMTMIDRSISNMVTSHTTSISAGDKKKGKKGKGNKKNKKGKKKKK
jgi:predicted RNase H-like nuclease (RuvC/YqgF family)